ncbi:xanthine dehydrogenase family protein molybdopterin-binding subunit [Rhodovulum sp. DZ06]|uniref:xanthine dehydrogenase family protein molybdopterin-binding subunit n=1 Tax=Rhodovulum sp. DZ06 TaxID=3425126 RepID=UPI003D334647
MKFGIGQPVRRKEDDRFLRGTGRYVDDITFPGQAHAAFLRSPVAHGTLVSVDASEAAAAPGVIAVYTGAEIEGRLKPLMNEAPVEQTDGAPVALAELSHLARGRVRFVGQPIAMVVAESRALAEDAAELIEFDIDELPVVIDAEAALAEGAPELHPDVAPGNRAYAWEMGDRAKTDAAFAEAEAKGKTVSLRVRNQRIVVNPMEPRASNVRYEDDRWLVWSGTQGVHALRAKLSRQLGVEPDRIRVQTPDVGGGFGMKLQAHPEDGLLCIAAKDTGRPVKWTSTRSEGFLSDAQARDLVTDVEAAFDAEGKMTAIRGKSVSNLGAYCSSFGAGIHSLFSAGLLGGMYDVPAMHIEVQGAFTNTTPTDAYRGAGRPEIINVTEHAIEAGAKAFGIDPVEMRRRNLIRPEQLPYTAQGGMTFDSLDPGRNIDDVLAMSDGAEDRRAAAEAKGKLFGRALVYYYERTGGGPVERATVKIGADGIVEAAVGTQSTGQGHETAWAQLITQQLGVPYEAIRLLDGDSDALPAGGGTGGSRSLIMASRVFLKAGEEIIDKGMEGAEKLLEAGRQDIEFDPEAGAYRIAGTDRSVTLTEVAAEMGGIDGTGAVDDREATFPNGAHVAEVEIDRETGALELTRYDIVDDFGVVINPLLVAGQVHGGVVQGLGQILHEAMRWDAETGQPLSASFMDYQMPRAQDLPGFQLKYNEIPSVTNPLGVKGCGEAGTVAALPAAALAVHDALERIGAEIPEPPFTPFKLWQAIDGAKG